MFFIFLVVRFCLSVFAESPSGHPEIYARRVPLPLLPVVFVYWWLKLAPLGFVVFVY